MLEEKTTLGSLDLGLHLTFFKTFSVQHGVHFAKYGLLRSRKAWSRGMLQDFPTLWLLQIASVWTECPSVSHHLLVTSTFKTQRCWQQNDPNGCHGGYCTAIFYIQLVCKISPLRTKCFRAQVPSNTCMPASGSADLRLLYGHTAGLNAQCHYFIYILTLPS